jgi:hypothetical protein
MPSVSYSETSSYLLCHRKWFYGYHRSLQRVNVSDSLALGSTGHKILETFYKTILAAGDSVKLQQKAFDTALSAAWAMYEQLVSEGFKDSDSKAPLAEILFEFYFPNEPFVRQGWQILAVEMDFTLEYNPEEELRFPFVVDLIARDPQGKTVVIDHKFVYEFYTYNDAALQPQIPLYIGGLRALNYKIDYGVYNMLRNRKIKAPRVDQRVGYLELKPNGTRVSRTFREQIDTANEIQALKDLPEEEIDLRMHRVANKMVCQSCQFRDLCMSELVGGNTKLMIATEYKLRERRVFATPSEENEEEP